MTNGEQRPRNQKPEKGFRKIVHGIQEGVRDFSARLGRKDWRVDARGEKPERLNHEVDKRSVSQQRSDDSRREPSSPPQPIPVDLCLIVPAGVVSHLKVNQPLTRKDICPIIDNAGFFCCIGKESPPPEQKWNLQFTPESILPNSERDVYIRIHIEDGGGMVGKSHPYGLKKNLPQMGGGEIQALSRLDNLSGRQHFNRT